MGKPSRSITPKVPLERNIRTRSSTLRKKSADESYDSQKMKPFFEDNNFPPRDFPIAQTKPKFFPNDDDIDQYFASCFNSNFKNKEIQHILEKEPNEEKNHRENKKTKSKIVLPKQEVFDEAAESQVKSSLASIEEEN